MAMAGTHTSNSKTDAHRAFEELLRKTEAHLKEKASLEFEGGKQDEVLKKKRQRLNDEVCSFELTPD
jgi:hypothetical protein